MVEVRRGEPASLSGAISTVEMHTGGEPLRVVVSGYPPILGKVLLEKRRYAREHLDHLRKLLIFEPRGHADMYGAVLMEPDLPEADLAVLFIHNEGYSTMCGHAVIALGRYAVDHGLVTVRYPVTEVAIQCPCGLVTVQVEVTKTPCGLETGGASFQSVPSFAFALDREVVVPEIGAIRCDIGYGGAFYAIVTAEAVDLDLGTARLETLVGVADRVTHAVAAQVPLAHPEAAELAFLYGTILTDGRDSYEVRPTRNLCVFAEREVDRSPTGSGVSARLAVQFARGQIGLGQPRRFESVTGATFTGTVTSSVKAGPYDAVRVEVAGRAFYTGTASFSVERADPLGGGFLLS